MKTIVPELSREDAIELVYEQRKELRFIGSQRVIRGLTMFEYDLTTGELNRLSLKKEFELNLDLTTSSVSRVDSRDMCLYIQALNEQNALRKVKQLLRRKGIRQQLFNPKKNGR